MKVLSIIGEFKEMILQGKKNVTIRIPGKKRFKKGEKVRIDCGNVILGEAVIKDVKRMKISEIPEDIIIRDGFSSREELLSKLKELYGRDIKEDTTVEVIEFELKKVINEEFYSHIYGNYDIVEIARRGLELKDLSQREKEILRKVLEYESIRKAALDLYGTINKRYLIRKVLRKVLRKIRKN